MKSVLLLFSSVLLAIAAPAQVDHRPSVRLMRPASQQTVVYPNLAGMWNLRLSNATNPPPNQVGVTPVYVRPHSTVRQRFVRDTE